jgi:hypothetical protein
MVAIRTSIRQRGFSEKATKRISGAVRQSTGVIYDSQWSIFCSWYLSKQIDRLSMTAQQLAEFFLYLFEDKGYTPSTIKGYKSAIARTIHLSGGPDFGSDEFLSLMFTNFCIERPKQRRLVPAWDLGVVLLRESCVLRQMSNHTTTADGRIFSECGDPAYPLSDGHIIAPYRGGVISRNQMIFNKRMSSVRICVEWVFGKVLSLFAYHDFKKNQKLYLQPVGKYYAIAVLLTNCHTCMYGSETSSFFNIQPPSLQDYIMG